MRLKAGLLGGGSSGTTCGTGELYGADDSVLGVDKLETLEVEVADCHRFAETEVVDIDDETLGNIGIDSLYLELLHREAQLTAGLDTLGVALELDGNLDGDGLLVIDLEEVEMKDGILDGVELNLLEYGHLLGTVEIEFYSKDVRSIDELADGFVGDYEICGDKCFVVRNLHQLLTGVECTGIGEVYEFASVENYRNLALAAESFGGLLAEVSTRLSCKFESVHCLNE